MHVKKYWETWSPADQHFEKYKGDPTVWKVHMTQKDRISGGYKEHWKGMSVSLKKEREIY